MVSISTALHSK